MPSLRPHLAANQLKALPLLFISVISGAAAFQSLARNSPPQEGLRTIVADDFTKGRPKGKVQRNSARKSGKATGGESSNGRRYRLASSTRPAVEIDFSTGSQLGLTVWKLRRANVAHSKAWRPVRYDSEPLGWIAERVEADTEFHKGDYLRLSIESPRAGYLYVIDRDWFADGGSAETNLIFPIRGDDNRLRAGKLIDIPAQNQTPFQATPKANQVGEILTIIVTSSPLELPIYEKPLPISNSQLVQWEEMWGGTTERFEMENGAGQVRTRHEQQAAARKGTRQLTRDDPPPQTIYVVPTKVMGAFLFNVKLSYGRWLHSSVPAGRTTRDKKGSRTLANVRQPLTLDS
jgi:hypothetical protein